MAPVDLQPRFQITLNQHLGQLRAANLRLGPGAPHAYLIAYAADFDVDPYPEMFYFPTDTLKLAVVTETGQILWKRDLGPGVVPGMWFTSFLCFDLDGDGIDEIYFVNNIDPKHPIGISNYRLDRLDANTGESTGQWQWPNNGGGQSLSHQFRNFIIPGRVHGRPLLITAQGTYGHMFFQAWDPGMKPRWTRAIDKADPGARGSHMCPVVDINHDGIDELMWGERCIELNTGTDLFCADKDVYRGHSDVIQPILNRDTGRWSLYTCREGDPNATPRVILYDDSGKRVWGHVEAGHIDMGWVARLGPERQFTAMAIKIDHKTCGPDGRFHAGREEYAFDALTGQPLKLPFSTYHTFPIDINGDGYHELTHSLDNEQIEIIDHTGKRLAQFPGKGIALGSKILSHPGEQLLVFQSDGTLTLWIDKNAEDSPPALARYEHPFYQTNQKLSASGSNLNTLGGI